MSKIKNNPKLRPHLYILAGLAVVIALVVLSPQSFLEKSATWFGSSRGSSKLISQVIGQVDKRRLNATLGTSVSSGDELVSGDTVVTHGDSKVLFKFSPAFWLMPYSKMEFVQKENGWSGHLIYGEIKITPGSGTQDAIELIHDSKVITEDNFSSTEDHLIAAIAPGEDEFKDLSTEEQLPQNLVEKQIFQTLILHKRFFQGCLIKYYKKKAGQVQGGETVFDLLIDTNGAIEKAKITRSDVNDPEYLDCLQKVFSRIRFKNLPLKEPLHAFFPLTVDLPK